MWCHLLLLPLAGLPLFFVLPWPVALGLNALLAMIALSLAVPAMGALRQPVVTGREALVGRIAEAASDIEREGLVRLDGELWRAEATDGTRVAKGQRVAVAEVRGMKLVVTPSPAYAPPVGTERR